ncbi:hypothetical protein [Bacillus sp. UMB0728]|uniref:hypothetical protein n=1 Tax=Bacillus sp. UMB0728 TaxID=2066052 RepID=UPI000C79156F|nr:hypothetical protein [Bacillus sp. UMB0728]PLR72235.1 hypothetical protein CYJ37_11815 [Bacillus sp. UMB0728]
MKYEVTWTEIDYDWHKEIQEHVNTTEQFTDIESAVTFYKEKSKDNFIEHIKLSVVLAELSNS